MYLTLNDAMDAIEAELDNFQWAYPDRANNRGEVEVDRDTGELVLIVWVADNDTPEDNTAKPLRASIPVGFDNARFQIRYLIHMYLCHEADEQIWFGEERPFYPH